MSRKTAIVCDIAGCDEEVDITGSSPAHEGWGRVRFESKAHNCWLDLCPSHAVSLAEWLFVGVDEEEAGEAPS